MLYKSAPGIVTSQFHSLIGLDPGGLAIGIRPSIAADPATEVGPWVVIDPDETVTIRVAAPKWARASGPPCP
jgi:hypothetical protein